MGVIIDILGSFVVRAAIVVVILNLMINLHQALSKKTDRVSLNESINGVANVIAADIKLAGFLGSSGTANKTFPVARVSEISFYADTGNTGTQQRIRYYTTPITPTSTNTAILYRQVIGTTTQTLMVARDITSIRILYYNSNGSLVSGSPVSGIKSINMTLVIKSNITERGYVIGGEGKYSADRDSSAQQVTWSRHFFPENL